MEKKKKKHNSIGFEPTTHLILRRELFGCVTGVRAKYANTTPEFSSQPVHVVSVTILVNFPSNNISSICLFLLKGYNTKKF